MPFAPTSKNVRPADVSRPKRRSKTLAPPPRSADDGAGRSLRRGLQILDAVRHGARDGVRVVDLCRLCGLQRAPVHRLLATLIETGYVAKRDRFRYEPGPNAAALARRSAAGDLTERLRPVLARISAECGDAAFAVLREGAISHCVARQLGTYPVQILHVQVGTRQPLGVGAAGLALLAALPPDEARAVIAANAPSLCHYGGMTAARLDLLVKATRERGWSAIGNHAVKGILGVGLAVHDADGTPIAGISVASTIGRMPKERQQQLARVIRKAIAALLPHGL